MNNIFETASRLSLRFPSTKGLLSVEDLWSLPLQSGTGKPNLDDIAKGLYLAIKESGDIISFVTPESGPNNGTNELALEVVKRIIEVRVAERDGEVVSKKRSEEKQKILALIADKQDEALKGRSLEELNAMVNSL